LRIGVALFLEVAAGVPDFGGLPLRFGVGATELDATPLSSSVRPFSGTVVVVVFSLRRTTLLGVGDWNSFRLTLLLCASLSSASTVTMIFCGDLSFPTSKAKVCFRGEGLTDDSREDAWDWLRVTRLDDIMAELSRDAFRGSGDDMTSIAEYDMIM
jgi:hypothetical protein